MNNNLPNHVGIIMDGNRRWAKERGKNASYGHQEGAKVLEKLAIHAKELGIKYLSVFAFSTDNFKRSKEEVDYLMDLSVKYFNEKLNKVIKNGVKIVFSGRKEGLRNDVILAMNKISEVTKDNMECLLNICFNYGGQEEIVDAALKLSDDIISGKITKEEVTREKFNSYLYQDLPPVDLIIRTGKEQRLSGFMLYRSFYSELYFPPKYFPDFLENDFDEAITFYQNRKRRFGGDNKDCKNNTNNL